MKILMVCLGNICRSPLAEGILRHKINESGLPSFVDSAGTAGYHIGNKPDSRMIETAKSFGINISDLRARQFVQSDFDEFDIIYAMDLSNQKNILSLARNENDKSKVKLVLKEIDPIKDLEVPDPYYGGKEGFVEVFNLLDQATNSIIEKIKLDGQR